MKKVELKLSKQNGVNCIGYTMVSADIYDETVADKVKGMSNIIPFQYSENNGVKEINSYANYELTLSSFLRNVVDKKTVLSIMSSVIAAYEIGQNGIPVSYIIKDADYIYVDDKLNLKFILLPIKQDAMGLNELPDLFRRLLTIMKFDEADTDNYVAKLLTLLNSNSFSIVKFKEYVDASLQEIGYFYSRENGLVSIARRGEEQSVNNNVKVNKLGVINNMQAANMQQMQGNPMFMNQGQAMQANIQMMQGMRPPMQQIPNQQMYPNQQMQYNPSMQNTNPFMGQQANAQSAPGMQAPQPFAQNNGAPQMGMVQQINQMNQMYSTNQGNSVNQMNPVSQVNPVNQANPTNQGMDSVNAANANQVAMPQPAVSSLTGMNVSPGETAEAKEKRLEQNINDILCDSNAQGAGETEEIKSEILKSNIVENKPETRSIQGSIMGQLNIKPVPHMIRKKTGEVINITKNEFTIGKSKLHADYSIENNPAISRVHCKVVQRDGVNYLIDNNSTNHTFVNGIMIEPGKEVLLKNKTTIYMGDEEFTFLLRKGE